MAKAACRASNSLKCAGRGTSSTWPLAGTVNVERQIRLDLPVGGEQALAVEEPVARRVDVDGDLRPRTAVQQEPVRRPAVQRQVLGQREVARVPGRARVEAILGMELPTEKGALGLQRHAIRADVPPCVPAMRFPNAGGRIRPAFERRRLLPEGALHRVAVVEPEVADDQEGEHRRPFGVAAPVDNDETLHSANQQEEARKETPPGDDDHALPRSDLVEPRAGERRIAVVPSEDQADERARMDGPELAVAATKPLVGEKENEEPHIAAELPPGEVGDRMGVITRLQRLDQRPDHLGERGDDGIVLCFNAWKPADDRVRQPDPKKADPERGADDQRAALPERPRAKVTDQRRPEDERQDRERDDDGVVDVREHVEADDDPKPDGATRALVPGERIDQKPGEQVEGQEHHVPHVEVQRQRGEEHGNDADRVHERAGAEQMPAEAAAPFVPNQLIEDDEDLEPDDRAEAEQDQAVRHEHGGLRIGHVRLPADGPGVPPGKLPVPLD